MAHGRMAHSSNGTQQKWEEKATRCACNIWRNILRKKEISQQPWMGEKVMQMDVTEIRYDAVK